MAEDRSQQGLLASFRLVIIGILVVIIVPALAFIIAAIGRSIVADPSDTAPVALDNSNTCVACHRKTTPGIIEQYSRSSMAAANVTCQNCHEVEAGYPGGIAHHGSFVLTVPTTAKCATCHQNEAAQFNASRHGLPAYVAMWGAGGLSEAHLAIYESIPEGSFNPDRMRNALFEKEGRAITKFACSGCHDIGAPAADGSIGQCQECHLRHEFSLEQARKPETCNHCHIGPDHPQYEIYIESYHGIAYLTGGDDWNWDAEPGTLTVADFPAPTCATCHISGFGGASTTHDVGDRLTWYLFAPQSQRRPAWQDNQVRMQAVCSECHSAAFIDEFYVDADALTEEINRRVQLSNETIAPARQAGLLTDEPFDQPIDFVHFDLWHHWGRTAKFGAWMGGPDYVQWHGAYEILRDQAELEEMVRELLEESDLAGSSAADGS
ncbi:MAG: multiheme c-type cytochrome [Chloroflexi bacterium]|nr:multiheme c-type cytochrome [Chloroflexota bacterium]